MVKTNHMLLANAVLKTYGGFRHPRFEKAFVCGSISPDCNPLTYFKGSIEYNFLHGHNYVNARRWMFRAIRRLQRHSHWTLWDYYTLGKITHYLGDAFIYPHNEHYPHGPVGHRLYEVEFRGAFKRYMADNPPVVCLGKPQLVEAIKTLHAQYMESSSVVQRDMGYIVKAVSMVMASCRPDGQPPLLEQVKVMEVA